MKSVYGRTAYVYTITSCLTIDMTTINRSYHNYNNKYTLVVKIVRHACI